ncbi:MAG: tetratricopeptide repeat protein [Bacteroidetes bacterium]|nr:tetratricopeptide repeat protein [Bacteroidota bacterium]
MKRTALILFGIYFAMLFNVNAQSKVGDAEKAIKDKDYSKALTIAKEVLDNEPPTEALKLLIQLREKNLVDKRLYEYLGDAYAKMNVAELALSNYAQAETMDSLDIPLKFKSAELLVKQKRYTEAVNKYLKIIAIDPKNAKAYVDAASILYQAKMFADAAVLYEKYIAIDQTKEAYERLTKAFLETTNYEKAHTYALEGLKKYPDDVQLKKDAAISSYALGVILTRNHSNGNGGGKPDSLETKKAQEYFKESTKYYAEIPDSQMTVSDLKNAGYAYQNLQADSLAIKYFEKVVKKDSTQSGLFMEMANTYFRNKQNALAIKYYKAKTQVDSTYEPAYRYMGFAAFQDGQYDEARRAFLKAKKLVDTTFATTYWLAQTYTKLDSTEQAADQFFNVLRLAEGKERQYKDEVFVANFFLGRRAFDKQNYNAAIPYLKRVLQYKPNDVGTTEMIAVSYHQLQNFDEAIKWYRQVLKLNPKSEIAKKGLRRLSAD